MKKTLLCIFLISCIFLSGCYGYRDINTVVFTTSIIFDIDKQNNPVIYLEIFKPAKTASKSSEQAQRMVLKGTGKTAYEALNDANLASSFKIDFSQNKAIIYTKRAAEHGIKNYFDIFRRDSQFVIRPYMAVYDGDVERLAKGNFEEEQFVGLFLWDLIDNVGASSRTVQSSLNQFLSMRVSPEKTDVLTVIKISDEEPVPTLVLEGGAIIKDDKLKDIIPATEGEAYNFLTNQVKTGSMEISDPNNKSKYISLRIEKSKTYTDVNLKGGKIKLKKKINVKASIVETQDYINLTDNEIKKIEKGAEKNLITACYNVFNKYKKEDVDIFMVGEEVENRYGDNMINDKKNIIEDTELEVEPHVSIDSPGKARRYK
jgi:Ger(x)C family germination protein